MAAEAACAALQASDAAQARPLLEAVAHLACSGSLPAQRFATETLFRMAAWRCVADFLRERQVSDALQGALSASVDEEVQRNIRKGMLVLKLAMDASQ